MGSSFLVGALKWLTGLALSVASTRMMGTQMAEPEKVSSTKSLLISVMSGVVISKHQLITKPIGRIFDGVRHLLRDDHHADNEETAALVKRITGECRTLLFRAVSNNPMTTVLFVMTLLLLVGVSQSYLYMKTSRTMQNNLLTDFEIECLLNGSCEIINGKVVRRKRPMRRVINLPTYGRRVSPILEADEND